MGSLAKDRGPLSSSTKVVKWDTMSLLCLLESEVLVAEQCRKLLGETKSSRHKG